MAKVPFSDEIADLVLDKLKDGEFIQSLIDDLRTVFHVSSLYHILLLTATVAHDPSALLYTHYITVLTAPLSLYISETKVMTAQHSTNKWP